MHFDIDFRDSTPFDHFWRGTGFSPAELILTPDMQQSLAWAGSVPHHGILYYRVHFLLELVEFRLSASGQAEYSWELLDQALAAILKNEGKPFFELMGNPTGFFNNFNDNRQLHLWKNLIAELARHLLARFGREELLSWYFETWNEPDGGGWWTQWPADEGSFCHYYDACAAGLWEVEPGLRLGGPGTCRHLSSLLKIFLAHLDGGKNYFSGAAVQRIDFLSVHEKGARSHLEDLTPDSQGIATREAEIVEYIRTHHPSLAGLPFMNNECDPQVGWWHTHTWHATAYYAAIAVKIIHQHLRTLADGLGVNYNLLSNDNGFIGFWGNRTLATRFGAEPFIDTGQVHHKPEVIRELREHGRPPFSMVKKPILGALTLLSLLGERRCAVRGGEAELGALATLRGDNQAAVLVYHSRDKLNACGEAVLTLALEGLPFRQAMLAHYRIDEGHANPYAAWEAAGAPDRPDAETLARLRRAQEPALLDEPKEVALEDGRLNLGFTLPLPGVSLVLLTARPENEPGKIGRTWVERYQGLNGPEDFVRWQGLESYALRSYEVLAAEGGADAPFQRVNETDLLCCGYLHAPRQPERVRYRVRALDYWGRVGEETEVLI